VLTGSHSFYLPPTRPSWLNSVSIRQMAPPEWGGTHSILLTTQFIDLGRMKGWVVGHPSAAVQVERGTGKVRRSKTNVLTTDAKHFLACRSDFELMILCDVVFTRTHWPQIAIIYPTVLRRFPDSGDPLKFNTYTGAPCVVSSIFSSLFVRCSPTRTWWKRRTEVSMDIVLN